MNEINAGGVRQRSVGIVLSGYGNAHVHAAHPDRNRRGCAVRHVPHPQADAVRAAERESVSRSCDPLLLPGLATRPEGLDGMECAS